MRPESQWARPMRFPALRAGRIAIVVQGVDFLVSGDAQGVKHFQKVLKNKYPVRVKAVVGPDSEDDHVCESLNCKVCGVNDQVAFEAGWRHVEKMLEDVCSQDDT